MAETKTQLEIEDWIRREWLSGKFRQRFIKDTVRLTSGGMFEFDAVSVDESIVACISTSGLTTSGGKPGSGKRHKIRSDLFFCLLTPSSKQRLMVFTEQDMYEFWLKEQKNGRVPRVIQFLIAAIPMELREKLSRAKAKSAEEVSGKR
ncbi:MAG: hypothetical protein U9N61_04825 [Euryarchaeota archaeon]|nr:hypothetical protein [Euryarchaeota archaeon]